MMEELTAKVFRTFNASHLFQNEISGINSKFDNYKDEDKLNVLLDFYNKANVKVAMLCNHQKNVSKSFNEQIEKMDDKIEELLEKKKELMTDKENSEINPRFFGLHFSGDHVVVKQGNAIDEIGDITALDEELAQSDRFLQGGVSA
jgi:uncharacterized protein YacL (UPF0231 family)